MKTLQSFLPMSNKKANLFRLLITFFDSPKQETEEMKVIKQNVSAFLADGTFIVDHTAKLTSPIWNDDKVKDMLPTMLRKRLLFAAMAYYTELAYNAKISASWDVLSDYLTDNAIKEITKPKRDAKGRFIKA